MSLLLLDSERFGEHWNPPGHPERVERAEVMRTVAEKWREAGTPVVSPREASLEELMRVHDESHVRRIAGTANRAVRLDPDTYTSPESYGVALLAAGAAVGCVEEVLGVAPSGEAVGGRVTRAVALARPPGHHAERNRAMGFCLFNNAACAAAHALALGLGRVAIVDYDVHHGNGTQWIFYDDARVLYVSCHQYPFYPGTGAVYEVGAGEGEGYTLNVPLEAGATDADYDLVFRRAIVPVLSSYAPELVIVSAGFDAHERDPLAGMRMSVRGYRQLAAHMVEVANQCSGGRIAVVCEGGYHLESLAACLDATLEVLAGNSEVVSQPLSGSTDRAEVALRQVSAAQKPFWRGL
jgi:acetoin utilization deacetylase AcuC-like enzyme